jgi:succinate dehydrogenase/fumarate reductase flavoprotein subunit
MVEGRHGGPVMCPAMQRIMRRQHVVFRDSKLQTDGLSALDDVIAMMWDDHGATDRSMVFSTFLVETFELGPFGAALERGCLDTA